VKEIVVTPHMGTTVVSTIDERGDVTVVQLEKHEVCKIVSAMLLSAFEPEQFSEEKVEQGAQMILGEE